MKKYLLVLLFSLTGCFDADPTLPTNYKEIVEGQVFLANSYDGRQLHTIRVLKVTPTGETRTSRIKRYYRRFNFLVTIQFSKDCYLLGETCVSSDEKSSIDSKHYTLKNRSETLQIKAFISYNKTNKGWVMNSSAELAKKK